MHVNEPENLRLKIARIGLTITDWLGGGCVVAIAALIIGKQTGLL